MSSKLQAALHTEYQQAFDRCTVRSESLGLAHGIAKRMVDLRSHYDVIETKTSVPWWFAGILHYKEWNFRAPDLFEQKIADVLIAKKYHQANPRTLAAYLWGFDLWNGFQYGSGNQSTWVWGSTNVLTVPARQMGAGGILKHLHAQGLVQGLVQPAAAQAATIQPAIIQPTAPSP
ncbi:hypothetical protein [Leptothoe sp. PORK10 BA2]|uniref:hypothetical protein n=1 Tax=Leptothoe sp. PORK10 BA2 TaxID=3110254 RepID=UPI002B1FD85A|nr:hypothetical protein [Leptothoe sp. PORK10 BA2]MEA5463570.1 hypothetical protein [Leptothoe sp. PORK10 BA2]